MFQLSTLLDVGSVQASGMGRHHSSSIMELLEEKQLVEDAKSDSESFARLYDRYFPKIYGYVAAKVGNRSDAEDIVSDVFMKALENLHTFEWRGIPFAAWLFTIARNTLNNFYSKHQKSRTSELLENVHRTEDKESSPTKKAAEGELAARVREVLDQLPKRDLQVVELKFFGQMTNREIVSATGLSESHVAVILYRTLRKIKPDLQYFA